MSQLTRSRPSTSSAGRRGGHRHAGRGPTRGGENLARRIESTWRSLVDGVGAACPVCGHGLGTGGECSGCGARLD